MLMVVADNEVIFVKQGEIRPFFWNFVIYNMNNNETGKITGIINQDQCDGRVENQFYVVKNTLTLKNNKLVNNLFFVYIVNKNRSAVFCT